MFMQIPPFVSLCKYGFWSHERTHSIAMGQTFIHLIPKWLRINYSFVFMLISALRLVIMYKKQKNFEVKMRRRGLINMQTNE